MEGSNVVGLIIIVTISGLIFTGVCIFFIIIFWQEFKEFKDSPLLAPKPNVQPENSTTRTETEVVETRNEGLYSKKKSQQRKAKESRGAAGNNGSVDSSLCSSTVTLEISMAPDEYGSSEDSIIKCNTIPSPSTNSGSDPSRHPAGSSNCGCVV